MAQKLLRNGMCVFCRERPASRRGEHSLPKKIILQSFPPYNDGQKYRTVGVGQGHHNSFPPILIPCCDGQTGCNRTLHERFDRPALPIIEELFTNKGAVAAVNSAKAEIVGQWLLKTCLNLAHPETHQKFGPFSIAAHRWNLSTIADDLYGWMVTDQPPPAGLSVWVYRMPDPVPDDPASQWIALPTVVADGRTIEFQVSECGIRFFDGSLGLLNVTLVYHPGWAIEHPLEVDGRAVRTWPYNRGGTVNIAELPVISGQAVAWWAPGPEVRFAPGTYEDATLPLLRAGGKRDLMPFQSVPGVLAVAAPRVVLAS